MNLMLLPLLLLSATPASPNEIKEFDFMGFDTQSEISLDNPELIRCLGTVENGSCAIKRESIGDVRIYGATIMIKRKRLYEIVFEGARGDLGRAVETLSAKYGKPSTSDTVPSNHNSYIRFIEWKFKDGVLGISSDTADEWFYAGFSNRSNPDPKTPPKVDF